MFLSEYRKRVHMRLVVGIFVLAAALGAVKLWASGAISNWVLPAVMAGAVLGIIVFASVFGIYLRNRERRRSMDMRDSALW
jgi:hypothetical protein